MSDLDEFYGRIRAISEQVTQSLRIKSGNPALAGWGQFVETNSPVFQIGPYGTAAGLLVNQIAFPDAPTDQRMSAQLRAFWEEKPRGKLFPQNVRLAFTVLSLGKSTQQEIVVLREEVARELSNRQLTDGSWSDSPASTYGRPDATAWAVLALKRAGGFPTFVENGAKWLADRARGSGRIELLSSIGISAAILGHPNPGSVPGLRSRGFEILQKSNVGREELICFFDYDELRNGSTVSARDYLCFPAFYPVAILIDGLARGASTTEVVRLEAHRTEAIKNLVALSSGHAYKPPAARYSSTVDQAIYALSYEHLEGAVASKATALLVPIYLWSQNSLIVNLVIPIVLVAIAAITFKEPTSVPVTLQSIFGDHLSWLVTFATTYRSQIQVIFGLCVILAPRIPQKGWRLLFKKLPWR